MTHGNLPPFSVSHGDVLPNAPPEIILVVGDDALTWAEAPEGYERADLPVGAHWVAGRRILLKLIRPVEYQAEGEALEVYDHLVFRELLGADFEEVVTLPQAERRRALAVRSLDGFLADPLDFMRQIAGPNIFRIMAIAGILSGDKQDEDLYLPAKGDAAIGYEGVKLPRRARWLPDGRVRLDLAAPVMQVFANSGGQTEKRTDHVILRELIGEDLFEAGTLPNKAQLRELACRAIGNIGPTGANLLNKMIGPDYASITEIVMVFTGIGQTTGQ